MRTWHLTTREGYLLLTAVVIAFTLQLAGLYSAWRWQQIATRAYNLTVETERRCAPGYPVPTPWPGHAVVYSGGD